VSASADTPQNSAGTPPTTPLACARTFDIDIDSNRFDSNINIDIDSNRCPEPNPSNSQLGNSDPANSETPNADLPQPLRMVGPQHTAELLVHELMRHGISQRRSHKLVSEHGIDRAADILASLPHWRPRNAGAAIEKAFAEGPGKWPRAKEAGQPVQTALPMIGIVPGATRPGQPTAPAAAPTAPAARPVGSLMERATARLGEPFSTPPPAELLGDIRNKLRPRSEGAAQGG
jgi:hypothetical protein